MRAIMNEQRYIMKLCHENAISDKTRFPHYWETSSMTFFCEQGVVWEHIQSHSIRLPTVTSIYMLSCKYDTAGCSLDLRKHLLASSILASNFFIMNIARNT